MKAAVVCLTLASACLRASAGDAPDPNISPLPPDQSMKRFHVQPGYRLELVAAEPLVREPVAMAWDGDGRLYVVEMLGYMQDIRGTGEKEPVGRVSRLDDTDGDGKMDRRTTFLDKLVEPRAIVALDDAVIVAEPPYLWLARDTNGDGVADEKVAVDDRYGRRAQNVEMAPNGLLWAMDNWIYSVWEFAHKSDRFRYRRGALERGTTPGRGQWGIAQDSLGNLYHSISTEPFRDEQIRLDYWRRYDPLNTHARWYAPEWRRGSFDQVWPVVRTTDAHPGDSKLRPDGTLSNFTASCGQTIFRGDRLPGLEENFFIPEPVGRLIRRAVVEPRDGVRTLRNPHEPGEFITSSDGNFRPVNTYTGPDGCLYIVDMYRGIIQEAQWLNPQGQPYKEIKRLGYDRNFGRGRIYRLVADSTPPGPQPALLHAANEELVAALAHPNGWWRDTAQRLLVIRDDKRIVPALKAAAASSVSPWGRVHALWTLAGLDALDLPTLRAGFGDKDWRVRVSAVRASEPLVAREDNAAIVRALGSLANDRDVEVAKQLILTLGESRGPAAQELLWSVALRHLDKEMIAYATVASLANKGVRGYEQLARQPFFREIEARGPADQQAAEKWLQGWTLCLLRKGDSGEVEKLLGLISKAPPWRKRTLLSAFALGIEPQAGSLARDMRMIRFGKKPAALEALVAQSRRDKELGPLVETAQIWMTWPGEAKFALKNEAPLGGDDLKRYEHGRDIYNGLCIGCHQPNGRGLPHMAPPLAGSARVQGQEKTLLYILLHGMRGPIDGNEYQGQMASMAQNDDEWMASIATYVRLAFGNRGNPVLPETARRVRKQYPPQEPPYYIGGDLGHLEVPEGEAAAPVVADLVKRTGVAARGRAGFEKTCFLCHRIGAQGVDFGPELTAVGKRLDKAQIYESVLAPEKRVDDSYRGVSLETADGTVLSGIVKEDKHHSLVLVAPGGTRTEIKKSAIVRRLPQNGSFMPSGLEKAMTPDELVDLVEYLASLR